MRGLSKDRIEHDARRRLIQTLLRTGPLTARGLSREVEQPLGHVGHHLKVLAATGIVEAVPGKDRALGAATAFTVRLEGQPRWVFEILLGGFSLKTCLLLMNQIADAGSLGVTELAKRTGLPVNDVTRYLWYLDTIGLVESSL